jgi:hypothetical protein
MNLTKVNGTYSKELLENINEIRKVSFDKNTSLEYMRNYILEVIEPAYIDATAKKRFIEYLENCDSKKSIYWLCYNTIQKAMKHKPSRQLATY